MRRREFVALVAGSALVRPVAAWAQQTTKFYRIAILHPSRPVAKIVETSSVRDWREFFGELRRLGYVEGQNIVIERYSGEGRTDNYPALVQSVVGRNSDLVFVVSTPLAKLVKEATSTIPIVAVTTDDPVDAGLVSNLARPGGNLTGVSTDPGPEIWGKRFQLLREIVPTISKVGILALPGNSDRTAMLRTAEKVGIRCVGPLLIESGSEEDYRRFFLETSKDEADALLTDGSAEHITKQQLLVQLAATFRLPTIYTFRTFVDGGGLMAYGTDTGEVFRQSARSIDQIRRGGKPGDIPFYLPSKFELVINLTAAKELGLTVPPSVLSLADDLIE
jgi:putative tryptophan/tyrosine transport system substrate-binding protein